MGRIDAWDELSLFGIWDELSLGTNCRLGRIVAQPIEKWHTINKLTQCIEGFPFGKHLIGEFRKSTTITICETNGYSIRQNS